MNLDLAEATLPEDYASPAERQKAQQQVDQLHPDFARLPPREHRADSDYANSDAGGSEAGDDDARNALLEAIAGLKLPDPERYVRAIMQADGIVSARHRPLCASRMLC